MHIGDMICHAAEQKGADFLVLGRRGLGRFERMMIGSTSNYCLENAKCNVLIAKSELSAPELHSSKQEVIRLEEAERLRRIKEDAILEKAINKSRGVTKQVV